MFYARSGLLPNTNDVEVSFLGVGQQVLCLPVTRLICCQGPDRIAEPVLGAALGFQSADDRRDCPRAGRCHQAPECVTMPARSPSPPLHRTAPMVLMIDKLTTWRRGYTPHAKSGTLLHQ